MKMDAKQKRRMWKVAATHFLITLFVFWRLFHSFRPDSWTPFWFKVSVLLQPALSFFVWFFGFIPVPSGNFGGLIEFTEGLVILFSVPFWSIFFGWIFVKLDNWLNHFPVLGKRVF